MNIANRLNKIEKIKRKNSDISMIVADQVEGGYVINGNVDAVFTLSELEQYVEKHGIEILVTQEYE